MRYTPETNGTKGKRIAVTLMGAAILSLAFAGIQTLPFHGLFETLSVALLVGAIFMLVRFGMRSYSYAVEKDEDTLTGAMRDSLRVDELSKSGTYTVARLWLDDLERFERYDPKRKREWNSKIYVYLTDVGVKESWLLTFRDSEMSGTDTKIYLRIECDVALRTLLEERAASNREGA